jgi:putative ABC transport system permease protein
VTADHDDEARRLLAVPLARRLMLADPRRFATSVAGVGLALMLILLLDGLSTGIDARVTVYEERSGASLFVGQPGTTSFLGSTSVLPRATLEKVRSQPGVEWAAAIRGFFTVPRINGTSVPAYVVGSEPGQPGGPWALAAGREPGADDEVVVGQQFAQRCAVKLGDTVKLFGRPFKVVGIAADADMFMASFVFMTHRATDLLLNAPQSTSFILVGTDRPDAVRAQLHSMGINALTRHEIEQNDLALKGQAYSVGLNLMVGVAFVVGTLVIALTIYAAVMERRREYGIIKAIGATSSRLFRVVLSQSLVLAGIGLLAGGLLFVAGQSLLGVMKPQFAITLTFASVQRVVVAAVSMGLLATLLPARRLMAMAPALAFRGS